MPETINPGKKMAKVFANQIDRGLSGVAKRESIFPLTFSLVMGKLAKAQIKAKRIKNDKK